MSQKTKIPMDYIFQQIAEERRRQTELYGEQNHSPMMWQGILLEEVGEAAKEAVDWHFSEKPETAFQAKTSDSVTNNSRIKTWVKNAVFGTLVSCRESKKP